MTEWREQKLSDFMDFNPYTPLSKGIIAKKVTMEKLIPFNRKIQGYEDAVFSGGAKFKNGDTLVARITPCLENGKTAYVDFLDDEEVAFGSTEFIVLRAKEGISDSRFIFYFAISDEFRDTAIQLMSGTSGRQRVDTEALKRKVFTLPPLPEQKAIAEVLSSLDDKIDLLTKQNKTLEDLAQAYFRKWFIEEARDEWITGRLGDLCEVITKGTTPTTIKKNFVNNGINFLKVESISDSGAFLEDKFMHIDEETHNLLKRSQLKENDVLCSIAGTIGRIARVSKEILPANVNQALAIIRAKKYFRFIYYLLKSDIFQNEIHSRIVESVQANLSLSEISSIEIAIPEELINKFELFVAPIDDKVQNNKNQIRILSKLRDTLLPKLISGEIRIKM